MLVGSLPSSGSAMTHSPNMPTPEWLKESCGKLLLERIKQKNGVQNAMAALVPPSSGMFN